MLSLINTLKYMLLNVAPREKAEVGLIGTEDSGLQAQVIHQAEGHRTPNGTRNHGMEST